MIRRFNGMPRHDYKDVIGQSRSNKDYDFEKTVSVIKALGRNVPIGGSTLSDMDENRQAIESNIHNIVGMDLSQVTPMSLSEFGGSLSG